MPEKDIFLDYIKSLSTDLTEKTSEVKDETEMTKKVSMISEIINESIDPEYIKDISQTQDDVIIQYGLSKPKKTIIEAELKND